MVQTFGINQDNDIHLGPDGNLVIKSALPAIEEACRTASRAQLGEMVLATGLGIPNFQAIWVGVPDYNVWKAYLINTLQAVVGVRQAAVTSVSAEGGTLSYTARIQTQYGPGEVNG